MSETKFVYAKEDWRESVKRDGVSLLTGAALMALARWFDNNAFEWIVALIFAFWLIGRSVSLFKDNKKTPQELADWLAEEYDVRADR